MGEETAKRKGGGNQLGAQLTLPLTEAGGGKLFNPRGQSYPAFAAPAQECHLWGFSSSQLSLHKEKKNQTHARDGERGADQGE